MQHFCSSYSGFFLIIEQMPIRMSGFRLPFVTVWLKMLLIYLYWQKRQIEWFLSKAIRKMKTHRSFIYQRFYIKSTSYWLFGRKAQNMYKHLAAIVFVVWLEIVRWIDLNQMVRGLDDTQCSVQFPPQISNYSMANTHELINCYLLTVGGVYST